MNWMMVYKIDISLLDVLKCHRTALLIFLISYLRLSSSEFEKLRKFLFLMYIRTMASIDINFYFIFYIPVDSVIKSLRGLPWLNPAEVCTYVQYVKKAVFNSVPPGFSCIPHVFFTFCCCFCHCFHPINIL